SGGAEGACVSRSCRGQPAKRQSEARSAWRARRAARGGSRPLLHRQQALALHALAGGVARAADRFRLLTRLPFRGFFVVAAKFHLAKNPLALHLLLQRLEGLVDIVVADENLNAPFLSFRYPQCTGARRSATEARPRGLPMGRACSRISVKSPSPCFFRSSPLPLAASSAHLPETFMSRLKRPRASPAPTRPGADATRRAASPGRQ